MSDLRVALVSEGPTDTVVIAAALKALLPRPFILTQLQPEATRPAMGTGWGGVLRWCLDFAKRGYPTLERDPTLPGFDLFILHVDADIAEDSYGAISRDIAALATAKGWPPLPQSVPCPPSSGSADIVHACLLAWMGIATPGAKTVLCVPSKAIDAWLVAAIFEDGHRLLDGLECNLHVAKQLGSLPKNQRVPKTQRDYRAYERKITEAWPTVRRRCSQAEQFSLRVAAALSPGVEGG